MQRNEGGIERVAKAVIPILLAFGLTTGLASAARAAAAVRIMSLGDSITWGAGSSNLNGYRGPLFELLRKDGLVEKSKVNFVGSQASGVMCDNWHEGHSGWIIDEIAVAEHAAAPLAKPNVVLLHAGTNDMNRNIDVTGASARLGSLIDQTFQDNPGVTVVVAQIIRSNNAITDARIQSFNSQLPGVVQARLNAGKRIVLVDMWNALWPSDLADDLHPNDSGFQKMAAVWRQGIDQAIGRGWITKPAITGGGCRGGAPVARWVSRGTVASGVGTTGDRIRFADMDGDGRADYLSVRDDSSVELWINGGSNSSGGWDWYRRGVIASGVGTTGAHIQFADVTGDGRADYLNIRNDSSVELWASGGANSSGGWDWYYRGVIATGVGTTGDHIRFADMDGDGKADYLYLVGPAKA